MPSGHRQRDCEQHRPLLEEQETAAGGAASESVWFIQDGCGVVCAVFTWILLLFAGFVVNVVLLLPSQSRWFSLVNGLLFNSLTILALSSHLRTMLTDPGAVPKGTASSEQLENLQLRPGEVLYKCSKCCSIKPERAHHCSICGRCIRKMDHHCPWINNCVGENNQRFFILFNMYVSVVSGHALLLCGHQFISCVHAHWNTCSMFSPAVTILLMIFLSMEGLLFLTFTGAMFATQLHSVCTNQMDIERLQNETQRVPRVRRQPRLARVMAVVLVLVPVSPVSPGPVMDLNPNMGDQDLFWGSDQYDFSMVLHGSAQGCFWHFAHQGENFYLTFQVQWVTGIGHDSHLSVTVNSPSSLLVSTVDDASGQVDFKTKETGFYQMCFSNFHNRFGTMQIFLSFGVFYDNAAESSKPVGTKRQKNEEAEEKKEEAQRALNNTLAAIEETSHRVEKHVFQMFRFYNFGRMRRSADYFLLQSNGRYVTWWSATQSLLILAAGYLQLLFLKRLFISKTDSKLEKPRC